MTYPKILSLMTFAVLSACAAVPPDAVSRLGAAPSLDGGSFSTWGGITVAAELQQAGDRTALCGVRAESENQHIFTRGTAGRVAASGSAYVDGQLLHRGLAFLRKVPAAQNYGGQEANCIVTDRPWQDGDAGKPVTFRIPTQVVHREGDEFFGSGPIVMFRQTGPGA